MSLHSDLVEVLTPYANKIKGLVANLGNLSNLETTDKSSIVAAINEAARSGGTEIIIDNTLTQSGQAADAKAAGDAISQLSADLDDNVNDLKSALGYVTPQMYGAKADGTTDDTTAIQDAIDSGVSEVVFIGDYIITDSITLRSNIELRGANNSTLTLTTNSSSRLPVFSIPVGAHDIKLSDITLKSAKRATRIGILLNGNNYRFVARNVIIDSVGFGVDLYYSWNLQFYNCRFTNCTRGMNISEYNGSNIGTYKLLLEGCGFDNDNYGIIINNISTVIALLMTTFDHVTRCIDVEKTSELTLTQCGFESYTNILVVRGGTSTIINFVGMHSYIAEHTGVEDFAVTSGKVNCIGCTFASSFVANGARILCIACENAPSNSKQPVYENT